MRLPCDDGHQFHRPSSTTVEAEAAMTGLDYPPGTVAVLQARSLNGFFVSDLAAVTAAATEGARLAREAGDLYVLMIMLMNLGPSRSSPVTWTAPGR